MIELPLGLRHALESGECVLFIGAGIGKHLQNKEGKSAPSAFELAQEIADHFSINIGHVNDLAKVSQIVEIRKGRQELLTFLQKRLANLQPDETLQWLFTLRWRAIYTTNYDDSIQRAYELIPEPPQKPLTIALSSEIMDFDPYYEVPIYHLHGALFTPTRPMIIITEDDYARFMERRKMLFELLKRDFATSSILYIGYSNRDPNWNVIFNEIKAEFYPSPMPRSYRVSPDTNVIDNEILKAKDIQTIDLSYRDFQKLASNTLSDIKVDPDLLRKLRSDIPSDLSEAFEKSPAAVARLLSSWTYVNQAPFDEKPDTYNFLRGDQPNWGLIASKLHFERDIEENVYEDLLDYATSSARKPDVRMILGPAGYGVYTLMMSLCVKLVNERAGPVFMLRPGKYPVQGDIEFVSTLFSEKPFFFINNASDYSTKLYTIVHGLKESNTTAMFVLGERLNEWRQCHGKLTSREYQLEPLSDPEINRLLDCLANNSALGALAQLNRALQFATVKEKHSKELLVAMREATEGKSFDAILEDEYRGIGDTTSRRLYLAVCCFHQHNAYLRDSLLPNLIGKPLTDIYDETKDTTEGVVIYDCIDDRRGIYGARSRHRTIATVVWERCADAVEKDQILHSALSALNFSYKIDRDAFESFIRSDRLVDSIRSLEGKIQFFEKACKKDPDNPYVRQHYARMLSRQKKSELALSQIDVAMKMKLDSPVLHHTKGIVLMHLALETDSLDLARRRMAQSDASFRSALSLDRRSEYIYQGLAQLYRAWAERAPSDEESTAYISKAEEIINEGLKVVRVRDSLWIESSKIQKFLGDEPSRLQALERAVRESPGSVIARYLLGRAYLRAGRPKDTINILEPVIKSHHENFRCFVEYALAMLHLKKTYPQAIAVLRLSSLYGLSDPRFIATLGGMLFMNKDFSKAEQVFSESSKRAFTAQELNSIQFRPPNTDNLLIPIRMNGKVVAVKAGYAFIESVGYPRFLCPGSKFGGILMKQGLEVTFEPAFTARGAIADRPRIL